LLSLNKWIFFPLYTQENKQDQTISKFEAYAEEQRKAWQIPGMAIGIIKEQEILLAKGYGQRGLDDKRPVDENTIFQIGSLSKAFTAALVAINVDKKLLKWEDKVINHYPNFRLADPWVTAEFEINDLLAQRSGLPSHAGDSFSCRLSSGA
jgi:CubicO group peptidase (beta-lactamase class C family)